MRDLRTGAGKRMPAKSTAAAVAMSVALLLLALFSGGCGRGKEGPEESSVVGSEEAVPSGDQGLSVPEEGGGAPGVPPEEQGPVTYHTGEGEVTYEVSEEPVPEEKLGVPVYPGASYVPGSGGTVNESSPEGECTVVGGQYSTGDGFEKVFQWYRERLGDPVYADLSGGVVTWNRMEEGRVVTVGVRRETDHTSIMIYSLVGDPGLMNP